MDSGTVSPDLPDAFIDPKAFRGALGLFTTGVTIVTAAHPTVGLVGFTANSFNSVSLDPPLVLFSVAKTSKSLTPLLDAPGFAVNVLRRDQRDLSNRFARSVDGKFESVPFTIGRNGAPIFPDAIAAFDCVPHASFEGGDHIIVVGRVTGLEHDSEGDPLLYFRGRYRAIGPEITG